MNFGGTTKVKLSKDMLILKNNVDNYNTARSDDH